MLDHLKRHPETRHLPVYVLAGAGEDAAGLNGAKRDLRYAGALGCLTREATPDLLGEVFGELGRFLERRMRAVLVVENDERERDGLADLIGGPDVDVVGVASRDGALTELDSREFDCVVLSLELDDGSGFQLLDRIRRTKRFRDLPVIVHSRRELSPKDEARLRRYAEALVVKDVRSPERLLDETSLYLHRVEARLPSEAADARAAAHGRRRLQGQEGADRGRRRAERVRADERLRAPRHGGRVRRERPRGHRGAEGEPRHLARPDGHHDAGDGRHETTRAVREMPEYTRCRSSRSPPRR